MTQDLTANLQLLGEKKIPKDDYLAIGLPVNWVRNRDRRIKSIQIFIAPNGDLIIRKKATA